MHRTVSIHRCENGLLQPPRPDDVAVEEPLEIRIEGEVMTIAMRTPGADRELAAGWLLAEGLVHSADDIADIVERPGEDRRSAMTDVLLKRPESFSATKHRRAAFSNASCGLCGAATVEQVLRSFPKIESAFLISASHLFPLPARLHAEQATFHRTGGLHACALFDVQGNLLAAREDVGRHNALDKLLGWALLTHRIPLHDHLLLLSGRVSFEMVQKALAARVPMIISIGAPSSLAVEIAEAADLSLVSFLRETTFNVYAGAKRIRGASASTAPAPRMMGEIFRGTSRH